jgi:hypothetical protein
MTRDDRDALLRAWGKWNDGRAVTNQNCLDFLDQVVRPEVAFAGIHVFEVLDLLVNAEPERQSA